MISDCILVISGEYVCCRVVFETMVGVYVFINVIWCC